MLPASLNPSPHFPPGLPRHRTASHLVQWLLEEDSGVTATPPAATWSRCWSGSASRTESWGTLPRQRGPGIPSRSVHRTHLCQRRGRWCVPRACTHPQHRLSGKAGSPQPPYLPGLSASVQGCRGGGLPAAGGYADGGQAESPAPPTPRVPLGASQGSGLLGEGVPTPLAAQRRGPSPPPPPGHSPCLFLPAIPLLPSAAGVIPHQTPILAGAHSPHTPPRNPGWQGQA